VIDRRLLQLIDSHRLPELYAPTGEAPKGRCNSWLKGKWPSWPASPTMTSPPATWPTDRAIGSRIDPRGRGQGGQRVAGLARGGPAARADLDLDWPAGEHPLAFRDRPPAPGSQE